jgi:hypothetical protein
MQRSCLKVGFRRKFSPISVQGSDVIFSSESERRHARAPVLQRIESLNATTLKDIRCFAAPETNP